MTSFTLEDINIRTVLMPGDIGYVTYMHGRFYQEEYGFGVSFEAYVAKGLHEFYEHYDPHADGVWVAGHEGKMVGFLVLMHREPAVAQLRYFIIDPAYRGIGLGKKLARLFMDFFHAKGYCKAYLWTTSELFAAANLYKHMGFTLTEEMASDAFGKPLKEQRYELVLNEVKK
jgi:ribosomal protein S18 acetylase RimI-like enzyme